jgi:hypothetical protein
MKGDALASGQRSATFAVAPKIKFDEAEMRLDLTRLPASAFKAKYLIAQTEYDLLTSGDGVAVNDFAEQMKRQAEFYERGLAADAKQADSLKRECFLTPFVPLGLMGRVIVDRDEPATPRGERGRLLIPKALRKEKTMLPTTGHIIKAVVFDQNGINVSDEYLGKRILFSPMSGTAICFTGYPTWIELELSEILAVVNKEDAQVIEETLEPLV